MPLRPPPEAPQADPRDAGLLADVALGAVRLTPEQGLALLTAAPTLTLGRWADARCRSLHGDSLRTYIIDRNINYTNVCSAKCTFCAFRRDADDHDAYTLDPAQIHDKIGELVAIGGTQILMQGGMNPALPLEWYTSLLRGIKDRFPQVHIHAFSPPEFIEFVRFFDPPGSTLEAKIRWVMVRLRDAGLDSLPGGGGEIFAEPVRRRIGLGKCDAEAWLTTMYVAHTLGMFTSATMMFGHIEGHADRIHHMHLVRRWQDRALEEASRHQGVKASSEGRASSPASPSMAGCLDGSMPSALGHYKAFISWPFQRENTPLGRVRDWGDRPEEQEPGAVFPGDLVANLTGDGDPRAGTEFGRRVRRAGAIEYLRTQAVSRLFLDNIYSIGASWVTMGPHVGQTALAFGANDMGSVMMEENVVSAAGTTYCLNEPVLCRLIREAGFIPAQRDNAYDILRVHDTASSPDRRVTDWSAHRAKRLHVQTEPPEAATVELTTSAAS
ncbi:MAG TPA: dehypoxanthine futalosine cyclase [Phycisphaerales bacterium]|nr:dehypoxanthine futalosine cyclase [Phycisphaerales bacterium]